MSEPLVLGFDTSAAHCAAALLRGDKIVSSVAEDMSRGQAERLMPLLEEILNSNDVTWADLDRIGVGIGPGNFTGIRISVSAARGLALALGIEAVGINTFDAIGHDQPKPHVPAIPAPRDQFYIRADGQPPLLVTQEMAGAMELPLVGSPPPSKLAELIAMVASNRPLAEIIPPAPLYIKPADAAPARDQAPKILDHDV